MTKRAVGESKVSVRTRRCLKPLLKRYFSENAPYVSSTSYLPHISLNTSYDIFPPCCFLCSLYFIRLPISYYQPAFYYPISRHIVSHPSHIPSLTRDGNPKASSDPGEVLWTRVKKLTLEAWRIGWFRYHKEFVKSYKCILEFGDDFIYKKTAFTIMGFLRTQASLYLMANCGGAIRSFVLSYNIFIECGIYTQYQV